MIKDRPVKDTVFFILGVYSSTFLFLSILYPDLWLNHTQRLCLCLDSGILFQNTYLIVSHFFHGGIQLWDRFEQMNNAGFALSFGIYGVANVIAAFIFIVLSPFFTHPAEALYHAHLILFYGVTCLVRLMGGYFLLRKFVSNKAVLFISLIYLNTILTSYMMTPGYLLEAVFSFLPLALYAILCFFERMSVRSFLFVILVMSLTFVGSPVYTLGYFYQALHFFILSCIVSFLFQRGWHQWRGRSPLPRVEVLKNIGLAACCLFILLPYFWWGRSLVHDFYVYGSGLGGTKGRFNLIFNFTGYFYITGRAFANPLEFLGTALNYHHNIWHGSWPFMGASSLFLALAAIVLSKDKRKYFFAATVLFMLLINTACFIDNFFALPHYIQFALQHPAVFWARGIHPDEWALYTWLFISSIAHGINALTNPLSFLVRTFHQQALLMPMMLLPLVAMGLESCLHLWQRNEEAIYFKRGWALLMLCAVVFYWDLSGGTKTLGVYDASPATAENLKWYMLSMITIFAVFILIAMFSFSKRWIGWMVLGFAFAVDLAALMTYGHLDYSLKIDPVRLSPSYTHQAVVPDYQNPKILPFREYFNTQTNDTFPHIYDAMGMYGATYQFAPMGKFFRAWDIYEPRPKPYKDLYPDTQIQEYLIKNPRTLFFADDAFDSSAIKLDDILRLNLEQRVVMVDPEGYNRAFIKTNERVYIPPMVTKEKYYHLSLDRAQAKVHKLSSGSEYTFDLPKDFPFYLSTTVFTKDHDSWKLTEGNRILDPIQGELTATFTYDVQNIQDRKLTVLLSDDMAPADLVLQVKLPDRILNVWKNTNDDLGLTYAAPQDGWLVFNYPYDEKWELTIDGVKVPISRVNRYFMGAPVSGGEHQVLMRYWPHTSLRFWIFISMVLSVISLGGVFLYGIKQEPI